MDVHTKERHGRPHQQKAWVTTPKKGMANSNNKGTGDHTRQACGTTPEKGMDGQAWVTNGLEVAQWWNQDN